MSMKQSERFYMLDCNSQVHGIVVSVDKATKSPLARSEGVELQKQQQLLHWARRTHSLPLLTIPLARAYKELTCSP